MMQNYYTEILLALSRGNVRFVLAGGVAVVLHGVERMTMDIDLALEMSRENLEKFLSVMKQLSLVPRAPVPAEFILQKENVELMVNEKNALVFTFIDLDNPFKIVDIFLTEDHSFESLEKDSIAMSIQGQKIRVISKEKLIELKQGINPPRAKDIHDISELKKLIGI